jgi:hypothetical protein
MENVEKLGYVSEALEDLYPNSDVIVLIELGKEEYTKAQSSFRDVDKGFNKFSVKMDKTEFVFILSPDN